MAELIVIAGANGSGKSSLTKLSASDLPVIDPDVIARELAPENPESAAFAAARKAITRTRDYVNANCSFMVETTLAGNNYLNLMGEVKALGWIVTLIYVGIDNPNTNIQRVRSRVKLGGHDVPRVDILRRYERSLVNLNRAAKIADKLILYDNSTNIGYQIVATIEGDTTVIYMPEIPVWLARSNLKLEI